jgi:hypothetical protein
VLVFFALGGFASADSDTRFPNYNDMSSYDNNPYSNVSDVFVYDNQGRLVVGARLYDQEGNPIQLGNHYCTDPNTYEQTRSRALGYPYCPQNAPFGLLPSDPTLGGAARSAAGSPTPSATGPVPSASGPVPSASGPVPSVSGSPAPPSASGSVPPPTAGPSAPVPPSR